MTQDFLQIFFDGAATPWGTAWIGPGEQSSGLGGLQDGPVGPVSPRPFPGGLR